MTASAIEKAAVMLRREAESMKECHTVGVGGEWYGDSAKAEYEEMIAAADAAIAERDALRQALQGLLDALPSATTHPAINAARAAIARTTGDQP